MIFLQLEAGGDDITVQRIFDDFEWLQHSLTTENDIGGIIVSTNVFLLQILDCN